MENLLFLKSSMHKRPQRWPTPRTKTGLCAIASHWRTFKRSRENSRRHESLVPIAARAFRGLRNLGLQFRGKRKRADRDRANSAGGTAIDFSICYRGSRCIPAETSHSVVQNHIDDYRFQSAERLARQERPTTRDFGE